MSNTLELLVDDRRLRLDDRLRLHWIGPDGSAAAETAWESGAGAAGNEIRFRFAGESSTSLAVRYAFNARNQLTLQVPQQPGVPEDSGTLTLPGKIFADDVQDLEYVLLDEDGQLTERRLVVAARLDFPDGYRRLRVRFPDGTESFIQGNNRHRSLSASEYRSGGDLARDLLSFNAVTRNRIQGEDEDAPAEVKFYGRWDLHENALVFVTRYDPASLDTPDLYLAVGGQFRATNVGLVVEQGGKVAFQVNGRYQWNRNTLGWDLQVGYSRSSGLEARLGAEAEFIGRNGKLTLKGGATLKKGGQSTELTFDLKLTYAAANRNLVFRVEGDLQGYEVQFSGDFQIANGNVRFEIAFRDKDGQPSLSGLVEFGRYTQNSELKLSLEAVLGRNGLSLKLNLEFRFFWGPNGPVAELP